MDFHKFQIHLLLLVFFFLHFKFENINTFDNYITKNANNSNIFSIILNKLVSKFDVFSILSLVMKNNILSHMR